MKTYLFFILFICTSVTVISQEMLVSEFVVYDNEKTKKSFIDKIASITIGKTIDSTQLEADIRRLKRLPSIAHAYYQTHKKVDGTYKIIYGLQENFTIIPYVNVFTTNDNEFAYRLGVQEYNALGQNISVGVFFQKDIFYSYGINLKAPYLFSKSVGLQFNYQDLTTLEPVFLNSGTADYRYNNTSYEIAGLFALNTQNNILVGFNYFNEDYTYQAGATEDGIPQDLDVDKILYKLIYDYNKIDYYYQYTNGFRNTFNTQYVSSINGELPDFIIFRNDFLFYKRVGECGNWANRLTLGVASNNDSPFAPFAVDNNLNIRGVGNTIDRGTAAIVLNTEFRYTVFEKEDIIVQSNVFVDAGTWRNPGGDFGDFSKRQNLRVYPGLGMRFMHKRFLNTILRVDYGHGITQDATRGFVFGVGQYF